MSRSGSPGDSAPFLRALLAAIAAASFSTATALEGQESIVVVGAPVQVSESRPDLVHVEPTVAASPSDPSRLVAASMVVRRPRGDDFQDSWSVRVFASRDSGASWSPRPLPELPGDWAAGDPWLAWTGEGVVYLSLIANPSFLEGRAVETWVYRSTDGGWTWDGPEREVFGVGSEVDHPVVTSVREPSGAWSTYVVGTKTSGAGEGFRLAVHSSAGSGFLPLAPYLTERNGVNLGSAAALAGRGVAFTYFTMPEPPRGLWAVHRSPEGEWRETLIRDAILPVGFPMLAAERKNGSFGGRLYAVWVEGADARDQSDLSVMLSYSDDEGRHWSEPIRVHRHAEPTQRTLPFVAVNDEGSVAVAWMDWRNAPAGDCPELFLAVSTDGGASFAPEVSVSSEPRCFGTEANGAAARRWRLGGGDYLGMVADAEGRFHVVWPDSRTGVFQLWTTRIEVTVEEPPRVAR